SRAALAVQQVDEPLLPAVLVLEQLIEPGIVDDLRTAGDAGATLDAAEVRRRDEHLRIAAQAPYLPRPLPAPDEEPPSVVAHDPHRRRDRRAVPLERRQADVPLMGQGRDHPKLLLVYGVYQGVYTVYFADGKT